MTRAEFRGFVSALRDVMQGRRQDPADLEISERLDSAALTMPDGSLMEISRHHIEPEDETAMEMAAAVYDVYLDDGKFWR
jgi:hypothetical protein